MKAQWKAVFIVSLIILSLVWISVFSQSDNLLHIIACDVGQGDGFLITEGHNQIIVDGGPNDSILNCLSKHVPFWDKKIELVVSTHPELDHYGGLTAVFKNYSVDTLLALPMDSSSPQYQALKDMVGGSSTKVVNPTDATKVRLGLMSLDVVWPTERLLSELSSNDSASKSGNQNVLGAWTTKANPNTFAMVFNFSYKDFDALFTADTVPDVIPQIIATGRIKQVEYLKVPHHGSKNGLTQELLDITNPKIAVISAGRKNRYGHPHSEIIEMLKNENIPTYGTYQIGDVEVISDGKNFHLK